MIVHSAPPHRSSNRNALIRLVAVVLMALAGLAHTPGSLAASEPTTVIVFDGSGSMWGKPEGERAAKLVMARDALKTLLAKAPRTARVGLASYGHRRAGDCSDAEVIVKPEAGEGEAVSGALDRLNPRGRGPITQALREVAKELGDQTQPASVILIHDDLDNCQQDPCSTVGDLRRAHPKVTVHVVSLAMRKEDAQRIACLPRSTGGRHYEVATQANLVDALGEAMRLSGLDGTAVPFVAPAAQVAAAARPFDKPGVLLTASLAEGGPPIDLPVRWRVVRGGDASGAPVWEGDEPAPLVDLPTGRYDVEAWLGFVKVKGLVEAVQGERRALNLPLGAGTVKFGPVAPRAAAILRDAVITFRKVDAPISEPLAMQRGAEPEVALLAGSYIVSLTSGALRIDRGVTLKPGDRLPFQPPLTFGDLELVAVAGPNGAPLDDAVFTIFEDDPDAPQGRREIVRSSAPRPHFALPAGTYYVVARAGTAEARERIAVKPGEIEQRTMVLDLAQLTVSARLPGGLPAGSERVRHRLERIGGEPRESVHASRPTSQMQVAAGRYRLETRIGLGNVAVEREVELRPGAREQLTIEPPAGLAVLRLLEAQGGLAVADAAWDIRDSRGAVVWRGNETEARPLLMAGRYTVVATSRTRRAEAQIDVRAGEVRSLDLQAQ